MPYYVCESCGRHVEDGERHWTWTEANEHWERLKAEKEKVVSLPDPKERWKWLKIF